MISQELQEIFTGHRRDVIIETIEVEHEETALREFFCKYNQEVELTLEDGTKKAFKPSNFVLQLPQYDENGNLDISIAFAMVGFEYINKIENILLNYETKMKFKWRLYTESNFAYPQTQAPFVFSITAVDISKRNLTLNGALLLTIQKNIPSIMYTTEIFRGLKY